jgi:ATP adenylyltransferase
MPVLSDTTVIVEALEATYDHLHDAFAAQDGAIVSDGADAVAFDR